MLVYIYDENTKEFLYPYSPQENPKNPGTYIYPVNSTTIEPELKKGFVPVFYDNKWEFVKDFRGQKIINISEKQIYIAENIGELPENFILYSDYQKTDEYKQEQKKLELEKEKNELLLKINELDFKRIRAICEPEQDENNSSWLQNYTNQIVELRQKLKELK